jgi:hypothetical protein
MNNDRQSTWDYLGEGSLWVRIQKVFWLMAGYASLLWIFCSVVYVVGSGVR